MPPNLITLTPHLARRFLCSLALIAAATLPSYSQRTIVFGAAYPNGFACNGYASDELPQIMYSGETIFLPSGGIELSWVGGPNDPQGRGLRGFTKGGGRGQIDIILACPQVQRGIFIEYVDLSGPYFSPGLIINATFSRNCSQSYPVTATIRGDADQAIVRINLLDAFANQVLSQWGVSNTLNTLRIHTGGTGDFIVRRIYIE